MVADAVIIGTCAAVGGPVGLIVGLALAAAKHAGTDD